MGELLFQKYKCICVDDCIHKLRTLDTNVILKGPTNSGKYTIAKNAFPELVVLKSLEDIQDLRYSFKKHIHLCIRRIDTFSFENQKYIANILDRNSLKFTVLLTCQKLNVHPKLLSICLIVSIPPPDILSVVNFINYNEGTQIMLESSNELSTIHDILLHCDLFLLKCIHNPLTAWKDVLFSNLQKLKTISFSNLRKIIYTIHFQNISSKCVIYETLNFFQSSNFDNNFKHYAVNKAAQCEHNMCLGNKQIFHLEMFLFSLKYKICYNK